MKVNVICPGGSFGSLNYCAEILAIYLRKLGHEVIVSNDYKEGYHNILIDETISSILREKKADIWWTDTPCMLPNSYHNLKKHLDKGLFRKHYVTSNFMVEHCHSLGIPTHGVIYRLMHPKLFNYSYYNENKKYDVMVIGNKCMCDRKRITLARNIVIKNNIKSVFVTNAFIPTRPYIIKYGFGMIDDDLKGKLYNESKFLIWLSYCEGFGMPPLEAMICGCVPIYTDCPAHNEFTEGIKIPVIKRIKVGCYGARIYKYVIDEKEAEEIILQAISMPKEEYQDLCERCIEKGIEVHNETLKKIDLLLDKG